jgi:hypothetical protein
MLSGDQVVKESLFDRIAFVVTEEIRRGKKDKNADGPNADEANRGFDCASRLWSCRVIG